MTMDYPQLSRFPRAVRLSWEEVEEFLWNIALEIKKDGYDPDTIVAVARGGLVPGRILADLLQKKNVCSFQMGHWEDDATLSVKIKWVMSRPVRTVRPDATVAGMIECMRRCGGRCLPVVDAKGAVQGVVTVFDILLRILESDKNMSWQGRPPQAPVLML